MLPAANNVCVYHFMWHLHCCCCFVVVAFDDFAYFTLTSFYNLAACSFANVVAAACCCWFSAIAVNWQKSCKCILLIFRLRVVFFLLLWCFFFPSNLYWTLDWLLKSLVRSFFRYFWVRFFFFLALGDLCWIKLSVIKYYIRALFYVFSFSFFMEMEGGQRIDLKKKKIKSKKKFTSNRNFSFGCIKATYILLFTVEFNIA